MTNQQFSSIGVPSWTIERWVRRNSQLTGTPFLIALTVASMHSSKTGYAYPSLETIAHSARVSIKTAQRGIIEMKNSGEWHVVSGRGGRLGQRGYTTLRANRYYPTKLLSQQATMPTREDQALHELAQALDLAGVANQEERHALTQLYQALPRKYAKDLIRGIAKAEQAPALQEVIDLLATLNADFNLPKLIHERIQSSNSPPRVILPWLATWGLTAIDHAEYLLEEINPLDQYAGF